MSFFSKTKDEISYENSFSDKFGLNPDKKDNLFT